MPCSSVKHSFSNPLDIQQPWVNQSWRVIALAIASLVTLSCVHFRESVDQAGSEGFSSAGKVGVMVMAHGGTDEWNSAVEEAISPLGSFWPVAIAFGMANPMTLQEAVKKLERQGVDRIAVVRLFISGESFLPQTEYLLGVRPDPPKHFLLHPLQKEGTSTGHHSNGKNRDTPVPVSRTAEVVLSEDGLLDSPVLGSIMAERVRAMSHSPEDESVLILAHGAGDDHENEQWIHKMDVVANRVRKLGPFRAVRVETLREDWPEKRKVAEERILQFVKEGSGNGKLVIVVPLRLYGFGPYEDVLDGMDYVSDGQALLPHSGITEWIRDRAARLISNAGWSPSHSSG